MSQKANTQDTLAETKISPQAATQKLQKLGYTTPSQIETMVREGLGSHYTRALGVIAGSSEIQDINELYHQLYPDEKRSVTVDDIDAARAADEAAANGAWDKFMKQEVG